MVVVCAGLLLGADQPKIPPMPLAVTGNAVVAVKSGTEIYSLMGIGAKRTWADITNRMFILSLRSGKWIEAKPVPGVAGRLGASAAVARGQVYVIGGYTVDGQGNELVVGDMNAYSTDGHQWQRAEDIPIPVADAVVGVAQGRYIYVVGGRTRNGPTNKVQIYDAEKGVWLEGTPYPGPAVFGHAGTVADEAIVYVDGAMKDPAGGKDYVASDECWMGKIDKKDVTKIAWSKLAAHPGTARFGIVAGAGERDHRILFSGGTTKPHDYKELDAAGKPAELSPITFAFDVHGAKWETVTEDTFDVRADVKGIAFTPIGALVVGGTLGNSAVSARTLMIPKK